jgi:hypothetical protein
MLMMQGVGDCDSLNCRICLDFVEFGEFGSEAVVGAMLCLRHVQTLLFDRLPLWALLVFDQALTRC